MNDHHRDEDRLRGLLSDAVADVEPDHRLDEIRRRTRSSNPDKMKVTAMPASANRPGPNQPSPSRRPWLLGALGAAVATAAVIGIVAVVSNRSTPDAGPSTSPSTGVSTDPSASPSLSPSSGGPSAVPGGDAQAMAVYYVGDGPQGPRLFREFHRVAPSAAVAEAATTPADPDYRTFWHPGDILSSSDQGSTIKVEMSGSSLGTRPSDLSAPEAAMAVQSLVYTAQATYQSRTPVEFMVGSTPMTSLYGVPLDGPATAGPVLRTLSLMSITAPEEGQQVSGTLDASGVSNGVEANVVWRLLRGTTVVKQGATTAEAWMGNKLYPWKTTISLAGVPAGTYTFMASTDSAGEGNGPDIDTRTVVIP